MASASVMRKWQEAEAVLDKYRSTILGKAGVVHVGVAFRIKPAKKGKAVAKMTKEVGICISVLKKRKNQFPAAYDGVPVDVIGISGRHLSPPALAAFQPGQGLFPVNHGPNDFGTLGAVVTDEDDDSLRFFLTCDHVVPDVGQIVKSSLPGNPDIGKVPPKKIGQRSTLVDCALIVPKPGLDFTDVIPGVPPPPFKIGKITLTDAQNQAAVFKVGDKTGRTSGKVFQHDGTIDIGGVMMINQIGILGDKGPFSFSKGGDSGAAVFRDKPGAPAEIVGLVVAENQQGISMASHFLEVARVLGIMP